MYMWVTLPKELRQIHVSMLFYFASLFLTFQSRSGEAGCPAPEGWSRCLTIAPRGYYGFTDWKGHFSVSSPTSRSSQISDQPLFVASSCKITYRCRPHRYAGPLANHNKSNTIHALYGLSNYDYSGSLGRCSHVLEPLLFDSVPMRQ